MSATPRISFGLFGLETKQDASFSTSTALQPFSKVGDLKADNAAANPFATFEPDFWHLDGGYKFKPTNDVLIHVGLLSLAMSNASGQFTNPPVLTVTFTEDHDTDGLTLRFMLYSGDYAKLIKVQYLDGSNVVIHEAFYTPDSAEFSTGQAVEGFRKLIIAFYSTNRPYRYLRVTGVDFGRLLHFEAGDIMLARVVEDLNPIGSEARIGTLDLKLHSTDGDFSILNPAGYYTALYQRQPMTAHENVNGRMVFLGQYYLETWKNTSDNEIEFSAVDLIGLLDTIPYRGGIWPAGVNLQTLLEAMFSAVGLPYELDPDLASVTLTGWIPAGTYREALQQIAFSAGAYVTCARSNAVKIRAAKVAALASGYDYTLTPAEKGVAQSLELRPLVTGADLLAHTFTASTTVKTVINGEMLSEGTYEIIFDEPLHTLSATGATITESGANYAILTVAAPGSVTLTGRTYTHTTKLHQVRDTTLSPSVKPNILRIDNATLVGSDNAQATIDRVFAYYLQRYRQEVRLYAPDLAAGDTAMVEALHGAQIRAVVETMEIDMAGGFVVDTTMTGVKHVE